MHLTEADAWKLSYACAVRFEAPTYAEKERRARYNGLDLDAVNQKLLKVS